MSGHVRAPADAAVFTCASDDRLFLDIWYRYYRRWFDDEQMVVLDHDTHDGSVERLREHTGVTTQRFDYPYFGDFDWYTATIRDVQAGLLDRWRTVVWCEPDELLWAEHGLGAYLTDLREDTATCTGFEIVQVPPEPPLDPSRPILAQRGHWYRARHYDKTLVARRPLTWEHGFHRVAGLEAVPDPRLRLIHLHRMDRELARMRHEQRAARRWREPVEPSSWGWHLRIAGPEFDRWYDAPLQEGRRELPWRGVPKVGRVRRIPDQVRRDLADL